jgi:hypothetical protein
MIELGGMADHHLPRSVQPGVIAAFILVHFPFVIFALRLEAAVSDATWSSSAAARRSQDSVVTATT